MVMQLAGKCMLFSVLWISSIKSFSTPHNLGPTNLFDLIKIDNPYIISQLLSIAYFLVITLGFLEVRNAVLLIILNLVRSIYINQEVLFIIKDLILISGLLSYYTKITELRPLSAAKKHNS